MLDLPEARRILADGRVRLALHAVLLAGLALGCLGALVLAVERPFPSAEPSTSGTIGWVTVHAYPKHREFPRYVALLLLAAATPLVCLIAWLFSARRTARGGLDLHGALNAHALGYLPAIGGLGFGLLDPPHSLRTLAWTLVAVCLAGFWPAWIPIAQRLLAKPGAWVRQASTGIWSRLLGAPNRLASSTVLLAGCVFGWFVPLGVAAYAPGLAAAWWAWPIAFLGVWLVVSHRAARADAEQPEAALRSSGAFLPAFLMLAAPFLLDYPQARVAVVATSSVLVVALNLAALRGSLQLGSETATRCVLRAGCVVAIVVVAMAWRWEPNYPGLQVGPLDGDSLTAWLNDGLHGKLVYRDFWYPYGPLFYGLELLSARCCGLDRYIVTSSLVATGVATLLLCLSARAVFVTWPFQVFGTLFLFFAWPPVTYTLRAYLGYFSLLFAVAAAHRGGAWAMRLAGALGGAAFLYSHEVAIACLLGTQVGLVWACREAPLRDLPRAYWRLLRPFAFGLSCVMLPAAALGAAFGLLGPYLRCVFGLIGSVDDCCGLAVPSLLGELPSSGGGLASLKKVGGVLLKGGTFQQFYLPMLLYLLAGLYLLARYLRGCPPILQDSSILGLAVSGVLMYRVALGRSEVGHAAFAAFPSLALAAALIERMVLRLGRLYGGIGAGNPGGRIGRIPMLERRLEMVFVAGGLGLLVLAYRFPVASLTTWTGAVDRLAQYFRQEPRPVGVPAIPGWQPVWGKDGGLYYFNAGVADTVKATQAYLDAHTAPGEGVFAFPYVCRYNFLLDRASPLEFGSTIWGAAAHPADRQRLLRELAARPPRYAVYDESEWPNTDGVPWSDRVPEISAYLFERYDLEVQIGTTSILRHRVSGTTAPPAVVDAARLQDRPFLVTGWFYPEDMGATRARWITTTATARLTRSGSQRELFVDAEIYVPTGRPPRWLTASLDGRELGRVNLSDRAGPSTLLFPLPPGAAADSVVLVQLDIDQPYPAADSRRLGLVVRRLGLR